VEVEEIVTQFLHFCDVVDQSEDFGLDGALALKALSEETGGERA
jgi:hypothetical protein